MAVSGQAVPTENHELEAITVDHSSQETVEAPVNNGDSPLTAMTLSSAEDTSPRASLVASTASSRLRHDDPVSETMPLDGLAPSDTDQLSSTLLDFPSPSGARPVIDDNGLGTLKAASN